MAIGEPIVDLGRKSCVSGRPFGRIAGRGRRPTHQFVSETPDEVGPRTFERAVFLAGAFPRVGQVAGPVSWRVIILRAWRPRQASSDFLPGPLNYWIMRPGNITMLSIRTAD